jgi:hypothetical protein
MSHLVFEFPAALYVGLPAALALVGFFGYQSVRRSESRSRRVTSLALRAAALLALVLLAARPARVDDQPREPPRRELCVLVDRSASMSLDETGLTRHKQAVDFLRDQLLPAARDAELRVRAFQFAEDAQPAQGPELRAATPDGKRTNLARGVLTTLASTPDPPAAIVVLSDGVITDHAENTRALSALLRARVPFVAVGFGSDVMARSLTLLGVTAPSTVPPDQPFHVAAQLQSTSSEAIPPFELLLLRDGQLVDRKTVSPGSGSRHWQESFEVTEKTEGLRNFAVQLLPPSIAGMHSSRTSATTSVRVGKEKDLRVLFVQGSLTWDYKFIRLALEDDPLIKLAGVTHTTQQSILHQTIEESDQMAAGFPDTLDELSKYRVVVLSNFRAEQLSAARQELVEKFCAELGGGVLVMGGPDTLDAAWNSAPLGRLLPVRLAAASFHQGATNPFRLEITRDALTHPVFRISDTSSQEVAWSSVPTFTHAAAVDAPKPGAQVWGVHSSARGLDGQPAVIMAQQRFGAGVAAVIGVQTFWRWRLGRDSNPDAFDRFWRQLLRYLAEAGRQDVVVRLPDQDLVPGATVRVIVERMTDPTARPAADRYTVRIEDPGARVVLEPSVELAPGGQAPLEFRAASAGMYRVSVLSNDQPLAFRALEIREGNLEFDNPARNIEALRQWASLTGGVAVPAEECRDASVLIETIREHRDAADATHKQAQSTPVGAHWATLLLLLALLGVEWAFRKRWDWL